MTQQTLKFPWSAVSVAAALVVAVAAVSLRPRQARGQATRSTTLPVAQPATQPAAAKFSPGVAAMLEALSGDDWQARRRAEDALVEAGDNAVGAIEEFLGRADDTEARTRAQSALRRIAENRVGGASYVTLHLKDAPAREAFAELARQAHAELRPYPDDLFDRPGLPRVTADFDRLPFWDALRELSRQSGIHLSRFNEGVRLIHGGAGAQAEGPSAIGGPFLIVATNLDRSHSVLLGAGPDAKAVERSRHSTFGIRFTVYAEPKLALVGDKGRVVVKEAFDENGNDLAVADPGDGGFAGGGNQAVWDVYGQLKYPKKNPGSTITRLRGTATFAVQTAAEKVEIADPVTSINNLTRAVNGLAVTFREFKKTGDPPLYALKLAIPPDAMRDPAWAPLQESLQKRLQVLDAKGQALELRGFNSHVDGAAIEFELEFGPSRHPQDGRASGEPAKLLWTVPTEAKEVSVDFEFKDLPMP